MITATQQVIPTDTDDTCHLDVREILDLVQVPDGHTIEAALIGWGTPLNDYCGLFLHFAPLDPSKLDNFAEWGRQADVLIEFYDSNLERHFVDEIVRHWPASEIYNYGCLCCSDERPYPYVH